MKRLWGKGRERSALPWGRWRWGGGLEGGEDLGRGAGGADGGRRGAVRQEVDVVLLGFAGRTDGGFFGAGASELGEELLGEAAVAGSGAICDELAAGREGAEAFVDDELFYSLRGLRGGRGGGASLGEVGGGDLEAVEEEASPARVDLIGGDAAEDIDDGELEAGAVVAIGKVEVEGAPAAATGAGVRGGFAGGVVVVAELFPAECGRAAAAAVGLYVAALEAFWLNIGHDGVWALHPSVWQSLRTIRVRSGLPVCVFPSRGSKAKSPAFGRAPLSV